MKTRRYFLFSGLGHCLVCNFITDNTNFSAAGTKTMLDLSKQILLNKYLASSIIHFTTNYTSFFGVCTYIAYFARYPYELGRIYMRTRTLLTKCVKNIEKITHENDLRIFKWQRFVGTGGPEAHTHRFHTYRKNMNINADHPVIL